MKTTLSTTTVDCELSKESARKSVDIAELKEQHDRLNGEYQIKSSSYVIYEDSDAQDILNTFLALPSLEQENKKDLRAAIANINKMEESFLMTVFIVPHYDLAGTSETIILFDQNYMNACGKNCKMVLTLPFNAENINKESSFTGFKDALRKVMSKFNLF